MHTFIVAPLGVPFFGVNTFVTHGGFGVLGTTPFVVGGFGIRDTVTVDRFKGDANDADDGPGRTIQLERL